MKTLLFMDAFLSSTDCTIYIKDINNKYLLVNEEFKKSLKLKHDYNPANKTDFDFFSTLEAQVNYEHDKQVIQTGKAITKIKSFIPGTRKRKHGLISKYPVLDSANKIKGLLCLMIDITDEIKNTNTYKNVKQVTNKHNKIRNLSLYTAFLIVPCVFLVWS